MKKTLHFTPSAAVCSSAIDITVEDGIVKEVCFTGGCHGNAQGVAMLVKDRKVEEVIEKLEHIRCGGKKTSCPDQLAQALREISK